MAAWSGVTRSPNRSSPRSFRLIIHTAGIRSICAVMPASGNFPYPRIPSTFAARTAWGSSAGSSTWANSRFRSRSASIRWTAFSTDALSDVPGRRCSRATLRVRMPSMIFDGRPRR